ncbi:hypothetical protein QFX18_00325 [Saccharophagus degradans]|uniref:hypothetical protein n=1 Tax=Saccharophagus degradans TaxID=86304 RepID=UPI002477E335|nr:hypothetical protein [Saccharophagus degradans]WGO98508.1 hypothetical protein QFX18_00325 [Saccharophagus degradans]
MKLVLLPGMDGTGELFNPLLQHLQSDTTVLPLPERGEQSYTQIATAIAPRLPKQDYILLAESFSSGLVRYIVEQDDKHLLGVVIVSGFVSAPNRALLRLAKSLPLHLLANMPGFDTVCRKYFLGEAATNDAIVMLKDVLKSVPPEVLKARMAAILDMPKETAFKCAIPCVCIVPTEDKLVDSSKTKELANSFSNVAISPISGPHFILQSNPLLAAKSVRCAMNYIHITAQQSRQLH